VVAAGEAAPLFLMILGFFLNAFKATGLENLLIPGFGEIGRAEEEISTRRWYAYQGRFFGGLRKKSPARGCLLTGLEEVGMKERRETSFRSTILMSNSCARFKLISSQSANPIFHPMSLRVTFALDSCHQSLLLNVLIPDSRYLWMVG